MATYADAPIATRPRPRPDEGPRRHAPHECATPVPCLLALRHTSACFHDATLTEDGEDGEESICDGVEPNKVTLEVRKRKSENGMIFPSGVPCLRPLVLPSFLPLAYTPLN